MKIKFKGVFWPRKNFSRGGVGGLRMQIFREGGGGGGLRRQIQNENDSRKHCL